MIDYNLPDAKLLESKAAYDFLVWQPQFSCVVIGQSNSVKDSVITDRGNEIPVLQRPSGGEAVLLTSRMICLSIVLNTEKLLPSRILFDKINNKIIMALNDCGIKEVQKAGISDLAVHDKKILGSALYRRPGFVFYHAVLNVDENPHLLSEFLLEPQRQPQYRAGRQHNNFVTSLTLLGYNVDKQIIMEKIKYHMRDQKKLGG